MVASKDSTRFTTNSQHFEPAYVRLFKSGELQSRVASAHQMLHECNLCPRHCGIDRLAGETSVCNTGRLAEVASYFAHFGEEDCLRGTQGSGTIFFSRCGLKCVFCQNSDISHAGAGQPVASVRLARMMLDLQEIGAHNINFVTPDHVVPQILEALLLAVEKGLRLPLVYNSSGYCEPATLALLDGVIDIYMPDFKIWDDAAARTYLKAKDYPAVARAALKEMHRQVGDLVMDEHGLAKRGVLVRHLVMPNNLANTRELMCFLADEVSQDTYVNIMGQYHPDGLVSGEKYVEINRPLTRVEMAEAYQAAAAAGIWRLDERRRSTMRLLW